MANLSESDIKYMLDIRRKSLVVAIQSGNKAEIERVQKEIERYENMLGQHSTQKAISDLYAEFGKE